MAYELDNSVDDASSNTTKATGKELSRRVYEYNSTKDMISNIESAERIIIKGGKYALTIDLLPTDAEYRAVLDLLYNRTVRLKDEIMKLGSKL